MTLAAAATRVSAGLVSILRPVSITPFGWPVVPPVATIIAISSGGSAACGVVDQDVPAAEFGDRRRAAASQLASSVTSRVTKSLERMIWRIVSQFAELAGSPLAVSPEIAYGIFDGLFQQSLVKHLSGDAAAASDLRAQVEAGHGQAPPR